MTRTSNLFTASMTKAAATAAPPKLKPAPKPPRTTTALTTKLDVQAIHKMVAAIAAPGLAQLDARIAKLKRDMAILEQRFGTK